MAHTKDDNKINPLQCCHSNNSLTSVATDDENNSFGGDKQPVSLKDRSEEIVNNNNVFHLLEQDEKYHFPKRQAVDVRFENITFQASTWSVTKFKRGEYINLNQINVK
ncbi:hypothetical protein WA026_006020 [Henosepilachna vigintioctopunctata]|uniref:Uncharacterized protein n=1 Tax=Henosepilachna vigintioctopunctata TaxID=420089 RepID=A0AAW1TMP4_9CUCU